MQKLCQIVDEVQKILTYNRARVQGAQGLHQAEAKNGLPSGGHTQLQSATSATETLFMDSPTENEGPKTGLTQS